MRRFLKTLLIAVLLGCMLLSFGCTGPMPSKEEATKSERSLMAMDTVMTLTAYGPGAQEALKQAEAKIRYLELLLSTEEPSSEIAKLNAEGSWTLSKESAAVVIRSLEIYTLTDGLFDITIYPLMELWGFPSGELTIPSEEEIKALLPLIGTDQISFDAESGEIILGEGQKIDLGGIGKGYTSAKVIEVLKGNGVTSAIISLGGNVQCLGTKPDGSLWKVGIQDPENEDSGIAAVVQVKDKAVITSGGYRRFFEDEATGHVYCHIVDPFTGIPCESDLSSVTIVCEDAVLADGLSTALYLMGKEEAIIFWKEHADLFQCILIDDEGNLYVTEGIKDSVTSERKIEIIQK